MKHEHENDLYIEENHVNRLDNLMEVTTTKRWLTLLALGILLGTFVVWGIVGKVPSKMHMDGILIKGGGIRKVSHPYEGRLTDIKVLPGDKVKKGETIAIIEAYDIVEEINLLKKKLFMESDKSSQNAIDLGTQIKKMQDKLVYITSVVSPYDGRIIDIKFNRGDYLKMSETLVNVEVEGNSVKDLIGVFYINAEESSNISLNKEVEIYPVNIKKEEYGYLEGKIVSISEYPVTRQALLSELGNEQLVDNFMKNGSPIEVRVDLTVKKDEASVGNDYTYKWSLKKAPHFKLESGTFAKGEVIIKEESPINLILHGGGSGH